MKEIMARVGSVQLSGLVDTFATELIFDGDIWVEVIKSRNKTYYEVFCQVRPG